MNAKLAECLKKLRLSGMAQTLDVRLQEATANRLDHAEFLELVLADEMAIRQERLIARGLKAAGFIFGAPLEGALLARVIVAISMMSGVFVSALVFIGGMGFLGWAAGYVYDALGMTSLETTQGHTAK